jgi:hypothetical protein
MVEEGPPARRGGSRGGVVACSPTATRLGASLDVTLLGEPARLPSVRRQPH